MTGPRRCWRCRWWPPHRRAVARGTLQLVWQGVARARRTGAAPWVGFWWGPVRCDGRTVTVPGAVLQGRDADALERAAARVAARVGEAGTIVLVRSAGAWALPPVDQ